MPGPPDVDASARLVWDYLRLDHRLEKADCIIALGSHDTRVAERGAELFLEGWAPLLLFSGNLGALTRGLFPRPEAEVFAEVAVAMGVPPDAIITETRSTNTGENVDFSRQLLAERGLHPRKAIAVQKPYMERRTQATFAQHWPELELIVTSPRLDFDAYTGGTIPKDDVINVMVGDLQRLVVYARRGFSSPVEVPANVTAAFERLVAAGYTKRLLREE